MYSNQIIKSDYNKVVDYLFWIVFILFTNPGSILMALGEDRGDGGVNIVDYLFVVLAALYAFIIYKKDMGVNRDYRKIIKYLVIFLVYYFVVFGYFVPILKGSAGFTFKFVVIKSRQTIYSFALFIMVYSFYIRSSAIFFKLLLISSITVMSLFLITLITGVKILPIVTANRGFVNIDRIFLDNYGLMPLLIPMGVIVLAFKLDVIWKKMILIGFGLMFLTWLLSLSRRQIFGVIVYFFIAFVLYNYFQRKALLPFGKILNVLVYTLILGLFISLVFPKYIDAGYKTIEETIYVVEHGESTTGRKDERLGLNRKFLVDLIKKDPFFGTGFDNKWRTGAGDRLGYETSDYPLLAAFAMFGLFGVLIYLPIYLVLINSLFTDIKYLRNNSIDYNSYKFYFFMVFILYFVFDLIQYMNWFYPLAMSTDNVWYIYLAIYFASRHLFYHKEFNKIGI